ncbi:PQQ-dependent sugar dehydrogenase [Verrucomicrobiaceae bacterium 227]
MIKLLLVIWMALGCLLPVWALPPNFEQEVFIGGLKDPVTMAFAPDGRLFVGERITGKIRIVTSSGQLLPTPFLTLDVPPVRHRSAGVRGFAFDPDYPGSPYLYVFYLKQFPDGKRHNRLSRFTLSSSDPNLADPNSEVPLIELPFNNSATGSSGSHNGGAVVFGKNDQLYFTTGDGWDNSNGYFSGDNVQSLTTYTGKVFRLNKDGSIPTDNPFYTETTGDYRAIYALGLRNPYAATAHPVTGEILIFDVGTANGENKDHIFRVAAGDNYGHDGNSGIGTRTGTWAKVGTSIVSGGTWYFADQFPATYHGRLFTTAWKQGLKTITSIDDATVTDFASADVPNQGPLSPVIGPDGSLYYLNSTYETSNGQVCRVSYADSNTVAKPTIVPNGGTFIEGIDVSLSTTTAGAEIRYTTDDTTPTITSTLFTPPLTLTESTTVKAKAFFSGLDPSPMISSTFTILPGAPPAFTSGEITSANVSSPYLYDVEATGTPAPTFSLETSPPGMTINANTGLISWTPATSDDQTITIRASNGISPAALQTFIIDVTNFRLADSLEEAQLTPGLQYAYFENGSTSVKKSGAVTLPGLAAREQESSFAFRFTGFLEIPQDGDYHFTLIANGTASLLIGNASVSNSTIGLQAGKHAITILYQNETEASSLNIRWSGPGLSEQDIPATSYHRHLNPYGVFARMPSPAFLNFPPSENGGLPLLLSETGAFADLSALIPADGLVVYGMNSPFWSDGASKLRWISVPTDTRITFRTNDEWTFPPGTVLIKHFELGEERKRLETRFEIIKEDGIPYFLTYRWRADDTEADLVPTEGITETIFFDNGRSQSWDFPGRGNCVACHNSSVNHVLGPQTRQLNGLFRYPLSGTTDNQIRTWSHLGILTPPPAGVALPALTPLDDEGVSLELRVKSYFDSNCAFCHNPTASPEGTDFVLDFNTPMAHSGLIGGSAIDDLNLGPLARTIAPQDLKNSTLFRRFLSHDSKIQMPPVARNIVDPEARDTILAWILSLPPAHTSSDIPGAVKRWTFDDTVATGSWRNTLSPPIYTTGQIGNAITFDGIDDSVDLGPLDVSGDQLTISLWFRADNFDTHDARFLSKADGQFDQDHYWMLSALDGSKLRLRLKAGGNTTTLISPANILFTNTWIHVAAVYDGTTMKIYKDALEVASVAKSGVLDTSGTVDAAIGNQPLTATGGSRPFDGLIDDLRVYDRALSPAELAIVRNAGQQSNSAPTIELSPHRDFLTRSQIATLLGTASDTEDGDITGSLTWFSNKDEDFDPTAPDSLSDGEHLIILTGRDSAGSAISISRPLTIVSGFPGWASDLGLPSASPFLDPDGNGITLLEDYAFARAPASSIYELSPGETYLSMQFSPRHEAIDISYTVQFSSNLVDWIDGATFTPSGTHTVRVPTSGSLSLSQGPGTMSERDITPVMAGGKRFARLKVVLNE